MSNMQQIKCEKPFSDKQIGEIGEHAVIQKLMENGWYAMNWNIGFNNMKSVDIVCFNPDERKTVNIQVKTLGSLLMMPTLTLSQASFLIPMAI